MMKQMYIYSNWMNRNKVNEQFLFHLQNLILCPLIPPQIQIIRIK